MPMAELFPGGIIHSTTEILNECVKFYEGLYSATNLSENY